MLLPGRLSLSSTSRRRSFGIYASSARTSNVREFRARGQLWGQSSAPRDQAARRYTVLRAVFDSRRPTRTHQPCAFHQRGGRYPVQNKRACTSAGPCVLVARQIGGSIIIIVIVVPMAVPMPPARTSADIARSYVDVAADVRPFLRVDADGPGFGDRERGRDS